MLTEEEKKEIEDLKKDPYVKIATKSLRRPQDPEKKKLYQLRWLRKKGMQLMQDLENELDDGEEEAL